MKEIPITQRPPYFVYDHYFPEWEEDFSEWNRYQHSIPNFRTWLFDQIEYSAINELRNPALKNELVATLDTARSYDRTCLNMPPIETIVTHMYVCELLIKALLLFFWEDLKKHHWYEAKTDSKINSAIKTPFDCYLESRDGLSAQLHGLFYSQELPKQLPSVREYFRLCPELMKECSEIFKTPACVFPCSEGYGASGLHTDPEKHYHYCKPQPFVSTLPGYRGIGMNIDQCFPDLISYDKWGHTSLGVEESDKADNFISATADLDGSKYALWFGATGVPKQRDVEVRFYIVYLLGSLARYSPNDWQDMRTKNPGFYLMAKRFLESNHILFPFLILRYITGRGYAFGSGKTSYWS